MIKTALNVYQLSRIRFSKRQSALGLISIFVVCLGFVQTAMAAPPVRLSVVPGGGSGIEQEIVDHICQQLDGNEMAVVSTINPDWYVICKVTENNDQVSGQIRYNGNCTIKTADGQVIDTVAVQKYNQDFSLQPGTPLNKTLVDSAARDVIDALSQRVVTKLKNALQTEEETRDRLINAESLAVADHFDEAINIMAALGPDTVHYKEAQKELTRFRMEKEALQLMQSATAKAKKMQYTGAISLLKEISGNSKRHSQAKRLIAEYQVQLRRLSQNNSKLKANVKEPGNPLKKAALD